MRWTREVYELPPNHGFTARPGHKVLVLDRGAVLLEYPGTWAVQPGRHQIDLRDAPSTEASTCVLSVSYLRLPLVDWSDLPLARLVLDAIEAGDRELIGRGPVVDASRKHLEIAWIELKVVDENERREARSRLCLARREGLQCLITFDFWPEDEGRLGPVWDVVLESLRLGVVLPDPTRGRRIG